MSEKNGSFTTLLAEQVANEFTASQQYIAVAVWFDANHLPRLADYFYQHSLEERDHAMMMVQYQLDRELPITIPSVGGVRSEFTSPVEALQFLLEYEQTVTSQIEALFEAARSSRDALGEQFMMWFLKEQVDEIALMSTLTAIGRRAGDNWFQIEEYIARDSVTGHNASTPPAIAGSNRG